MSTIIAILTSASSLGTFKGNRGNYRNLIRAAKRYGAVAYVVTTPELWRALQAPRDRSDDRQSSSVSGFTCLGTGGNLGWRRARFPFPNVIYNRIPTRADERNKRTLLLIRRLLEDTRLRFFNPRFFDKFTLSQWVGELAELRRHIPATEPLRNDKSLLAMLDAHPQVFLKPVHGMAGAGMMHVIRVSADEWYLRSQSEAKAKMRRFNRFTDLWNAIKRKRRGRNYLIQQYVSLAKAGHAPFDLRLLLQKNAASKWTVTGIGARVAGRDSMTTHVPKGGRIGSPHPLLRQSFGEAGAKKKLQEVAKFAVQTARQIESKASGLIGEMSMDIGVDVQGRHWFFEANARPMKFDEATIRRRSLRKWVRFCQALDRSER